MGVVATAAGTSAALIAGAAAIAALERRLAAPARDRSPARPTRWRTDVAPARTDPWLYAAAPIVALIALVLGAVVVPIGPGLVAADLSIGLFYFIVVVDILALALALGGWGAGTGDGVEACYRAVAQLVAYLVPLGLAVLGPIMMARSLSTVAIVNAQRDAGLWYVLVQPLGFIIYLLTGAMQCYRPPLSEPFAETIAGGVLGAYGGARALLWRIALSGALLVIAAIGAVLFFAGHAGPWLPGPVWMAIKTLAIAATIVWLGARVTPRGTAATLALAWKLLVPVGLANVLAVGISILLGVGQAPFGGA